jgi:hypothetical protein
MKYVRIYDYMHDEMVQGMISDAGAKKIVMSDAEVSDTIFPDTRLISRFGSERNLPMSEWSDQLGGDEPEVWREKHGAHAAPGMR